MSLFDAFMTDCQMLDRRTVSTGLGVEVEWVPGAKFRATVIKNQTLAAKVAEKEGVREIYTITAEPSVELDFHDVVKRLSDGATFRVTTNSADSKTPEVASFQFVQVSAERWDPPND